jgi:hypothetical protein
MKGNMAAANILQSSQLATGRLQRPYFRNGPSHRSGADVSFGDIVKIFDFQRIKIGRWVSPTEQQIAANLFFDALCDLQSMLQVPAQVISLNGSLALSFGIGGRLGSCAYYQPAGRVLALAKNAGGGSLAHEWFHAFDHYIAAKMFEAVPCRHSFASKLWLQHQEMRPHPLNDLLHGAFRLLFVDPTGQQPSEFFKHCQSFDNKNKCLYFAMPEEMAARAFEHMLQQQQFQNSFLVSGCLTGPAAKAGLYPSPELSKALAENWLAYFAQLGQLLQLKQLILG